MTGLYRETGVVLRTHLLGETDRIITVLLRGRGKRRCVAKGSRKPGSRFSGRLQPCAHVALQLYEGRSELHTVTQVESLDQWKAIIGDLDRLTRASELLEVVDQLVPDGAADPRLHDMLVGALRALEANGSALVVPAFMLKLFVHEGLGPSLQECASCAEPGPLVAFDLNHGGLLCSRCRRGKGVSDELVHLMRRVLGGELGAVLAEEAGPEADDFDALMSEAMEAHIERRLRSRSVARQM